MEGDEDEERPRKRRRERATRVVPEDRPDRPCGRYARPEQDQTGRNLCVTCGWEEYPHSVVTQVDRRPTPAPGPPKRRHRGRHNWINDVCARCKMRRPPNE